MVEFARGPDGRLSFGYGGDTFNMAVYLARAGIDVAYATALGDDRYSDGILALAAAEGVRSDIVLRVPDRLPGLCLIETDAAGERQFFYWRDSSPARELFEIPDWRRVAEAILGAKLVFFSGITLSIYSNNGIGRFLALVEMARSFGATERVIWWRILIPGAMPAIMAGLRIGLGRAVLGSVTIELLLVAVGIGKLMMEFRGLLRGDMVFAVALAMVAEAVLLMAILHLVAVRVFPWAGTPAAGRE